MLALRNSKPAVFEDLWDSFFNNNFWLDRNFNDQPAYYYYDDDSKEHVVTIQVPGFKKEDIKIEVDHQGITLSGEIKDDKIKGRVSRNNFNYSMRKYGIDPKTVDASLEDGILFVKFKTEKEKSTKIIEIK
jgi:HSP20 family protein